jgi:hypothetical protein
MARTATKLTCPDCGEVSPCPVQSETELRSFDGDFGHSGRYVFESQPEINYYRRVRECGACGVIFETAEVSERLLVELAALRGGLRDARREGSTAIAHTTATEDSLRKLRKALDVEE